MGNAGTVQWPDDHGCGNVTRHFSEQVESHYIKDRRAEARHARNRYSRDSFRKLSQKSLHAPILRRCNNLMLSEHTVRLVAAIDRQSRDPKQS
jgi:hypothetical protein